MSNKANEKFQSLVPDNWEDLADAIESTPESARVFASAFKDKEERPVRKLEHKTDEMKADTHDQQHPILNDGRPPSPDFGKVRILKRNPNQHDKSSPRNSSAPVVPVKTYEERKAAYDEARLRIFGCLDDEDEPSVDPPAVTSAQTGDAGS